MTGSVLASWHDGPAKRAIVEFVTASAADGSPEFVPPADRIATFDNDGTLWVEKPAPPQVDFLLRTWAGEAQRDPSLAATQPYKAIVERDRSFFAGLAEQQPEVIRALEEAAGRSWDGTTPEEFDAQARAFFTTVEQEKFGVPYDRLTYQPMIELFRFLEDHDYRVFVCSGGGRDFMRVIAEDTWGILKERVIGTAPEYEYRDGALIRQPRVLGGLALGPGKPEHIFSRTGRLPLFAGGNADVDIEMLEAARFALLVVHDDDEREYAYTDGAEKSLTAAGKHGWTLVSVKNDWTTVFSGAVGA